MRIKSFFLVFAALAMFMFPAVTKAETNKTITTLDTPGSATDVIVADNYAYVADGSSGITVINVTTPTSPSIVRSVVLPDVPTRLDISGTYLYVADTSSVKIMSLADATNPTVVGTYEQTGLTVTDVASDGTYVYVLGSLNGQAVLEVIDVTNPASPAYKSLVNVNGGSDVVLSSNYAYVVGGQKMDIVNAYPTLTIAGTYTDPAGSASYGGVQVYGSTAYVNDPVLGLHAINIASPSSPTLSFDSASISPSIGYGTGIAISNGYAFLTRDTSGGMTVYDIASTTTPKFIDTFSGPATAGFLTIANNIAYITAGAAGVQLVDVAVPDAVPPVVTPVGNTDPVIIPGAKYTDPGVTVDSGTVVTTGAVDTSKVGRYTLTYTVTDRSGNVTTLKRTVLVGPTVEKLALKNNTYTLKVGKKYVVLRPFTGYRGAILGRKIIVNTKNDPFYVFIATDAMKKPELVIYNASGRVTTRQNLSTISTKGLQVEITSNPATLSVFYALAPKANGLTATIYNISKSGFKSLKTVTAAKGRATLLMKWVKGYTNEYILVTLIKGKLDRPLVWRYNGVKKSFVRDTKFVVTRLLWTKTAVKLK